MTQAGDVADLPRALDSYPAQADTGLLQLLAERVSVEPFNAIATVIFACAILHTFAAVPIAAYARRVQQRHDEQYLARGEAAQPSLAAELLFFLGEVEVVFGLWAVVLLLAMTAYGSWGVASHYFNEVVTYTEPLFVVVIMALAATRPIIALAESALRRVAAVGAGSPAAWWLAILMVGPMLGSFVTEPGAMTICAVLLARQFYVHAPGVRLKYATIGLLFVNVSIGGTLTHFAAPPVLMVARPWAWDLRFMATQFAWRAALAIVISTAAYFFAFRRELAALRPGSGGIPEDAGEEPDHASGLLPVPVWLTLAHLAFMAWTVVTAHYPAFFVGGFLVFLGFAKATAVFQSRIDLKAPLLVGFFLAGLVIHGGLQGWWIAPVLGRLAEFPLFLASTFLTSFNDNAMITYLATLVPNLDEALKIAVVQGAVTGGGLTVIANAPNPAGQAILGRFFDGGVSPLGLLAGALPPTIIAALAFRLL